MTNTTCKNKLYCEQKTHLLHGGLTSLLSKGKIKKKRVNLPKFRFISNLCCITELLVEITRWQLFGVGQQFCNDVWIKLRHQTFNSANIYESGVILLVVGLILIVVDWFGIKIWFAQPLFIFKNWWMIVIIIIVTLIFQILMIDWDISAKVNIFAFFLLLLGLW